MDRLIAQRFDELTKKAGSIERNRHRSQFSDEEYVDSYSVHEWATSVLNLLQRTFGEDSVHFQKFDERYKMFDETLKSFFDCRGVFQAAKEDFEGGYLFSVRALVRAELLSDDVLEQAVELLQGGQKDLACILARVALESALKELCTRAEIAHAKLDRMNADLYKAGIYNLAKHKDITAWAQRGNDAAHGNWSAYTEADVDDFIKGVNRFIADYL